MNIEELSGMLKHIGLEPWPDGRSILDGKRPIEQHVMMIVNSLKAERDVAREKIREYQLACQKVDRCCGCLNYEYKTLERGEPAPKKPEDEL